MGDDPKPIASGDVAPPVAPTTPPGSETVPLENLKKLQSVYDKKIGDLSTQLSDIMKAHGQLKEELEASRKEMPADKAQFLKLEADVKRKDTMLAAREAEVNTKALRVRANELIAEHKITDLKVDDLVRDYKDETSLELAVLRAVTTPKVKPNVPSAGTVDVTGTRSGGGPLGDDDRIAAAIARAIKVKS